jgi:plastocyanin domain-containing protein
MQYEFLTNIGGFIWWILKGKRKSLKVEQSQKYWSRNLITFIVVGYILGYISVKYLS